jgi:ABC-2 type transport system permease protein
MALFHLASLYMPLLLWIFGKLSFGHLAAGYLGVFLLGSATVAMGLFASTLTRSQILAGLIGAVISVAFLVSHFLARASERPFSEVLSTFALWFHMAPFQSGLVQLQHVGFFLLLIYVMLFAATRVLEARRWK